MGDVSNNGVESTPQAIVFGYLQCTEKKSTRYFVLAARLSETRIKFLGGERYQSALEECRGSAITTKAAEKSEAYEGTANVMVEDVCGCASFAIQKK